MHRYLIRLKSAAAIFCIAVLTGAEVMALSVSLVVGVRAPIQCWPIAVDRVRYVGEPVAVVFADDAYLAEDVADQVRLKVEKLPVLLQADQPPGEFEPGRSTAVGDVRKDYGDLDKAFRSAHAIVALELSVGRHSGVPLETRGAIGRYDGAR